MRWNPKEVYRDELLIAQRVVEREDVSDEDVRRLAHTLQELVQYIEDDEKAVYATLQECGGHLTLSSLVTYYKSMKRKLEDV